MAPNEKSGDESLRLGFVVQGSVSKPNDVDVYSFKATAGTEVWFDIDRTTMSLDAIVELVDSNGQIVAQSDQSLRESTGAQPVYSDPTQILSNQANVLQKSSYYNTNLASGLPKDSWTTNPRDAGLRVVLPGGLNAVNTYHVRVRSSNIDRLDPAANPADLQDPAKLANGLTAGNYSLQIRLRETDEFAGTTIRYADIRYADNGITVSGMPVHSPLGGEVAEDTGDNDGVGGAQPLGNLNNADRATASIAGNASGGGDLDFYQFQVQHDSIQMGPSGPDVPYVFDLDYADGLGRPDFALSVFNSNGQLILYGQDSNVADDQGGPNQGADMDDLTRGSAGTYDPYIGTVMLPVGTYSAAVSTKSQIPSQLLQTQIAAPPSPGSAGAGRFGGPTG